VITAKFGQDERQMNKRFAERSLGKLQDRGIASASPSQKCGTKESPAMFPTLKSAVFAGLVGLAGLTALPANADSLYLGFGDRHNDPRFGVYMGEGGHAYYPPERYGDRDGWRGRGCSPDRALYKAESFGVHRARIDYVTPRRIGVSGRQHGDWVQLTFARAPGCPVLDW
jgi:hypothetical protein